MTKHSYVLIHQLSSRGNGSYEQLKDGYMNVKKLMEDLKQMYITYTKLTKVQLTKTLKRDIWWDVNESLQYGIIDEIYNNQ